MLEHDSADKQTQLNQDMDTVRGLISHMLLLTCWWLCFPVDAEPAFIGLFKWNVASVLHKTIYLKMMAVTGYEGTAPIVIAAKITQ